MGTCVTPQSHQINDYGTCLRDRAVSSGLTVGGYSRRVRRLVCKGNGLEALAFVVIVSKSRSVTCSPAAVLFTNAAVR